MAPVQTPARLLRGAQKQDEAPVAECRKAAFAIRRTGRRTVEA